MGTGSGAPLSACKFNADHSPSTILHLSEPAMTMSAAVMKTLEGVWRGEGRGVYPPHIPEFHYFEELTIKALPKPNTWELRSATKHKVTGKPMHSEVGFIRCFPVDERSGNIEFCLVHPFGVTEISQGQYSDNTVEVKAGVDSLNRTSTAKSPQTTELNRVYTLTETEDGKWVLDFVMDMATTNTPLQNHLICRLVKDS